MLEATIRRTAEAVGRIGRLEEERGSLSQRHPAERIEQLDPLMSVPVLGVHKWADSAVPLQLRSCQAERGPEQPGKRVADPVVVLHRSREGLGDHIIGQVPASAGEGVDAPPQGGTAVLPELVVVAGRDRPPFSQHQRFETHRR
jgi:hypothetical protein